MSQIQTNLANFPFLRCYQYSHLLSIKAKIAYKFSLITVPWSGNTWPGNRMLVCRLRDECCNTESWVIPSISTGTLLFQNVHNAKSCCVESKMLFKVLYWKGDFWENCGHCLHQLKKILPGFQTSSCSKKKKKLRSVSWMLKKWI